ncbi:MAG: BlaI/MecI/CopY family transcriptional regulator [Bacteroidota bacterium]
MKELTKAEEQLMKFLWKLERAHLKEIVESYPTPRPAYTTISTVVNVLVKKGFINYQSHGKVREYFPALSRQQYLAQNLGTLVKGFFDDSPKKFASFFTQNQDMTLSELQEIRALIDDEIKKQKTSL